MRDKTHMNIVKTQILRLRQEERKACVQLRVSYDAGWVAVYTYIRSRHSIPKPAGKILYERTPCRWIYYDSYMIIPRSCCTSSRSGSLTHVAIDPVQGITVRRSSVSGDIRLLDLPTMVLHINFSWLSGSMCSMCESCTLTQQQQGLTTVAWMVVIGGDAGFIITSPSPMQKQLSRVKYQPGSAFSYSSMLPWLMCIYIGTYIYVSL